MTRLTARTHVETGFEGANCGLVITRAGAVVIDSPYKPESALAFARRLGALSRRGVAYVVLTDHHFDHVSTAGFFGGRIVLNERCLPALQANRAASQRRTRMVLRHGGRLASSIRAMELPQPHLLFSDRLSLLVGGERIDIVRLGGHTPGTSCAHVPSAGVVYCGDNVVNGDFPYLGDGCYREWAAGLRYLLGLRAAWYVPGHGEPCGPEPLRRMLAFLAALERQAVRLAADLHGRRRRLRAPADLLPYFPRVAGWHPPRDEARAVAVRRMYEEITGETCPVG